MSERISPRAVAAVLLAALVYGVLYLYMIGDLAFSGGGGPWSFQWVTAPLERLFERRAGLQFEAVAVLRLPPLLWLLGPVNLLIGLGLGGLVGLNALLAYQALRSPRCATGGPVAALALLGPLFSGAACCAPLTLLALGIPATAAVLTVFDWLLPASAGVLALSALWLHRRLV